MIGAAAEIADDVESDVVEMLRGSVREFCARFPGAQRTRSLRWTDTPYDLSVWRAMADAGWLGIALPEKDGGSGLGLAEICVVAEELAADLAPEPFAPAAVAALAIAGGDNDALKARLLPGIIAGDAIPALAWQERANHLPGLTCDVRLEGDRLDGEKRFVAAAGAAGFVALASSATGAVLVWIDADAAGLTLETEELVDGGACHRLRFNGVAVDPGHIVASAAAAERLLPLLVDHAITIATAELVGLMKAAVEQSRSYVGQRIQFGKPIGSFQAIQHRLVDLWMQSELARACLEEAIGACVASSDAMQRARLVSAAKARASSAALTIGRQSIQLHGAIGYADEHDIGLYLKRAIVKSAWMGGAPLHRKRFAGLSGLGRLDGKDWK